MQSQFNVYTTSSCSSPLFGEMVVIVAAWLRDEFSYRGESFVLVDRTPATLYHAKLSFNSASVPEGIIPDKLDFMLEAALRAAKSDVGRLLKARFDMTSDWHIYDKPIEYEPVDRNHLAQLWIMGRWNEELKQLYSTSECEELVEWLRVVKQCQPISVSSSTFKI